MTAQTTQTKTPATSGKVTGVDSVTANALISVPSSLAQPSPFYPSRSPGKYLFNSEPIDVGYQEVKSRKLKPEDADFDYEPVALVLPDLCLPMSADTEFDTPKNWRGGLGGRVPITSQLKSIHETNEEAFVGVHAGVASLVNMARKNKRLDPFPILMSDAHFVDYLVDRGYSVELNRVSDVATLKDLPTLEVVYYSHLAVAELFQIHRGQLAEDLLNLTKASSPQITMTRRLTLSHQTQFGFNKDHIKTQWTVTINGFVYRLLITWFDSCALHGVASYKDLAEATGVTLKYKDNISQSEKENMLQTFIRRPKDVEDYARGDLSVYDLLKNNAEKFQEIWKALDIADYYQPPKMTIGSTVYNLFTNGKLKKECGFSHKRDESSVWKETIAVYLEPASAGTLRQRGYRSSALLAKVHGGRCRNNRPNVFTLDSLIADMDVDGAYGEGQRNQLYPIGKPEIYYDYDLTANSLDYHTLREFRKQVGDELVPGLWFALVSTTKPLKYPIDFLCSWFNESSKSDGDLQRKTADLVIKGICDTEREATDYSFNEEDGELKILTHEVINGVITHDFLQWLDHTCSKEQRADLLDSLVVKEAIFYSKHKRLNTPEDVFKANADWTGKTTAKRIGHGKNKRRQNEDGECHSWCAFNLGELIVNTLLINRKLYPKKTPLNTMYKLCVNTLYGDMTSKYFTSANVVVGNNITARCRAFVWMMEKGLHGIPTITDGCPFDVNRVVYPTRPNVKATASALTNLWNDTNPVTNRNLRIAPLDNAIAITATWVEYTGWDEKAEAPSTMFAPCLHVQHTKDDIEDIEPQFFDDKDHTECKILDNKAQQWIDEKALNHLRMLFKGVDVLHAPGSKIAPAKDPQTKAFVKNDYGHAVPTFTPRQGQFTIESKALYDFAIFHGASNYTFFNPNYAKGDTKMRSYELKKKHESVISKRYVDNPPAKDFMRQLKTPHSVERQEPFVKSAILKPGDYRNRAAFFDKHKLVPGDSYFKSGMMREFSLSQFTFSTRKQYLSWKKAVETAKEKYGQSLEAYFCNDDGTLDFAEMVLTVCHMTMTGVEKPFEYLDKHRHVTRKLAKQMLTREHKHHKAFVELKKTIASTTSIDLE
jgi:hypothetical protein